jgi:kynurenine formamidase
MTQPIDPGRIVDLTEPWSAESWPYPSHPRPVEGILQTIPVDRVNTWTLETTMHVGTHVDAPLHCASRGIDVASIPFERLIRPGYVVDLRDVVGEWHVITPEEVEAALPGPLEPGDALILRYGWQRYGRGHADEDAEMYFNRHPGPGRALVEWLVSKRVAWVGTDGPSFEHPANIYLRTMRPDLVEEMERAVGGAETFDDESWLIAHRELLGRGQMHVDQAGGEIGEVGSERVTLAIFPWRYVGGEASICRLVAFT